MSSEVIDFYELTFPHVICSLCRGNSLHIETEENDSGEVLFKWVICTDCGNPVPVSMTPVFSPTNLGV